MLVVNLLPIQLLELPSLADIMAAALVTIEVIAVFILMDKAEAEELTSALVKIAFMLVSLLLAEVAAPLLMAMKRPQNTAADLMEDAL